MKKIGNKSALLAALEGMRNEEPRDDEFTADDFFKEAKNAGKNVTLSSVRSYLKRMVDNKKLSCRKMIVNGTGTNFYSNL